MDRAQESRYDGFWISRGLEKGEMKTKGVSRALLNQVNEGEEING